MHHVSRCPLPALTRGCPLPGAGSQDFLEVAAKELKLRYGDDVTQGFILQLVLLPALKVACDELRVTRCNRRLQGKSGGVPAVRAETWPRPPERHRTLPEGTVTEWAQRYVQSGSGALSTVGAASHVVDKLTHNLEGANCTPDFQLANA